VKAEGGLAYHEIVREPRMTNIMTDRSNIEGEDIVNGKARQQSLRFCLVRPPHSVVTLEEDLNRRHHPGRAQVVVRRLQHIQSVMKVVIGILLSVYPP